MKDLSSYKFSAAVVSNSEQVKRELQDTIIAAADAIKCMSQIPELPFEQTSQLLTSMSRRISDVLGCMPQDNNEKLVWMVRSSAALLDELRVLAHSVTEHSSEAQVKTSLSEKVPLYERGWFKNAVALVGLIAAVITIVHEVKELTEPQQVHVDVYITVNGYLSEDAIQKKAEELIPLVEPFTELLHSTSGSLENAVFIAIEDDS